ncbi:MAG: GH116 family glycosyl-hydrolase [Candidatus Sumerlaeales bacterium]|nr:GH116 family glycosyl-hydrolase [Candidatus Sumerlaeales bacterium]
MHPRQRFYLSGLVVIISCVFSENASAQFFSFFGRRSQQEYQQQPVELTPTPRPRPKPRPIKPPKPTPKPTPYPAIPTLSSRMPGTWNAADGTATSYGGLYGGNYWDYGMPVGGIGTGAIELYADGRFGAASIMNNYDSSISLSGMVLALSVKTYSGGGKATLLCLDSSRPSLQSPALANLPALQAIHAQAAWPFMRLENLDFEPVRPLKVAINAWSPMVIGEEKDSSYPAMVIELDLTNPTNSPVAVGTELFVPNVIGSGGSRTPGDSFDVWPTMRHDALSTDSLYGVMMSAVSVPATRAATFTGTMFVGVETSGVLANRILHRDLDESNVSWWKTFESTQRPYASGAVPPQDGETWANVASFDSTKHARNGAVVGASLHLAPQERRIVPYIVAWHAPTIYPKTASNPVLKTMSAVRWGDAFQVATDLADNRKLLKSKTAAWHRSVMQSNYPTILKVRMVNDLSALVTNSVLLDDGRFMMMPSVASGRGIAGMMSHRLESYGFLSAAFPRLDASELSQFANLTDEHGNVPPMIGDIHEGLTMPKEFATVTGRVDLPAQMVVSLVSLIRQRHNTELGKMVAPKISAMLKQMQKCGDFSVYTVDTPTSGTSSYGTGIRIAALRAGAWLSGIVPPDKMKDHNRHASDSFAAQANALASDYATKFLRDAGIPRLDTTTDASFASALAGDWFLRGPLQGMRVILSDSQLAAACASLIATHITETDASGFGFYPVVNAKGVGLPDVVHLAPLMAQLIAEAFIGSPSADLAMMPMTRLIRCEWSMSDPWRQPLRIDAQTGKSVSVQGSPATMSSWRVAEAITGFSYDPYSETLFFDPKLPNEMKGKLSVPVFTPMLQGWLDYDVEATSATLTVHAMNPAERGEYLIKRIAKGVNEQGKFKGEKLLVYPQQLRPGKSYALMRKPVWIELE